MINYLMSSSLGQLEKHFSPMIKNRVAKEGDATRIQHPKLAILLKADPQR